MMDHITQVDQSFQMIALFTSLPTSLSCAIVSNWLDGKSLVRLDMAHCSNSTRQPLLDIFANRECVVQSFYCRFKSPTIKWIVLRGIKFAQLGIDSLGTEGEAYLAEHGHLVRSLQVDAANMSSEDMTTVSKHCRNLTKLNAFLFREGIDCHDILSVNTNLEEISIMMDESNERTDMQYFLPRLHTLYLQCTQQRSLDLCLAIITGASSLVRMVINGCGSSEGKLVQILQQCPQLRSVKLPPVAGMDQILAQVVALCPQIANIDLSQCHELTDEGVLNVAQGLKGLKSICVSSHCDLSNYMLKHLADHTSATLEEVYVFAAVVQTFDPEVQDGCGFGAGALAYLHQKCANLKAFRFSVLPFNNAIPTVHMFSQATALMLGALSTGLPEKIALHCKRLQALSLTFLQYGKPVPESEIINIVESCAALRVVYVPSAHAAQVKELLVSYPRVQVLEGTKKTFYYDALEMLV